MGGGGKPEPRGNGDSEVLTGPWSPAAQEAAWTQQRGAESYPCLLKDSPSPLCLNFPDNRMEKTRVSHPAPGKKGALLLWCFQTPRYTHTGAFLSSTWYLSPESGCQAQPTAVILRSLIPFGAPSPTQSGSLNLVPRTRTALSNTAATSPMRLFELSIHFLSH